MANLGNKRRIQLLETKRFQRNRAFWEYSHHYENNYIHRRCEPNV